MPSPLLIQILAIALLVMAACTTGRGPADLARGPDADARSRAALQADAITRVQASLRPERSSAIRSPRASRPGVTWWRAGPAATPS
jgi:hypothetical protein